MRATILMKTDSGRSCSVRFGVACHTRAERNGFWRNPGNRRSGTLVESLFRAELIGSCQNRSHANQIAAGETQDQIRPPSDYFHIAETDIALDRQFLP